MQVSGNINAPKPRLLHDMFSKAALSKSIDAVRAQLRCFSVGKITVQTSKCC